MERFDYAAAVAELEKIASIVEDPSTGLDDIDRYVTRSAELVAKCREYLRGVRDSLSEKPA